MSGVVILGLAALSAWLAINIAIDCGRGSDLGQALPGVIAGYAAVRAEALSSISFSRASFVHCCALRRRNLRSSSSLVRAAYHSHWRACSKHSAIVGDMTRSPACPPNVVREHYGCMASSLTFGKASLEAGLVSA
jgi:hypothetical protein